ncbi:tubulin-tyrosine ligase family protein (macronuclear) [Tetrahymena thermophila SB210]|uniref:Tubulin-tyrosine ligase family protein n=1 Tax=Tetrahymena thermophila (strain SB210) TaxID=312017 RepID=Q22NX5_TETTS|nr:tubulin-tyrosine ligase family protein [Tetrahymena thermophila SB210]EAR87036.2 tubulin-tyrosine ligase family protein [Tetrahymena thermophila SB210]|eukprot:XP_001007281.2 tubulin-tyrosine ligase family protein [Tetrahymena thermophila SB210]
MNYMQVCQQAQETNKNAIYQNTNPVLRYSANVNEIENYRQAERRNLHNYSIKNRISKSPPFQKERDDQNSLKKNMIMKLNEQQNSEQEEENKYFQQTNRIFKLPLMDKCNNNRPFSYSKISPKFHKKNKDIQLQTLTDRRQSNQDVQQMAEPLTQIINSNQLIFKVALGKQNFEKIKSLERQSLVQQQDQRSGSKNQENKKSACTQQQNQEFPSDLIRLQLTMNPSNSQSSKIFFMQNNGQVSLQQLTRNSQQNQIKTFQKIKTFYEGKQSYSPKRGTLNYSENGIQGVKITQQLPVYSTKFQNNKNQKFQSHFRTPKNDEYSENLQEEILKKQSASMNQTQLQVNQNSMNKLFIEDQIQNFHSTVKAKIKNQNNFNGEISSNQQFQKKKKSFQQTVENYNSQNLIQRIYSTSIFEETYLKVFIGAGNNSSLIKYISGQRWWFEIYDMNDKINPSIFSADSSVYSDQVKKDSRSHSFSRYLGELIWTQIKQNDIINDMPTLSELKQLKNEQIQCKKQQTLDSTQSTSCQTVDQKSLSQIEMKDSKENKSVTKTYENLSSEAKDIESIQLKGQNDQKDRQIFKMLNTPSIRIYNHFECNYQICNKKNMYYNLKELYEKRGENLLFERIPYTFHVKKASMKDSAFAQFSKYYNKIQNGIQLQQKKNSEKCCKNIWIVKPAENTNRGTGIFVSREIAEIKQFISQNTRTQSAHHGSANERKGSPKLKNKQVKHTYIIQKYIENPLLYQKRKIDIRCYILLTNYNGIIKAYWYKEGYIRTSSKEFTTKNLKNNFIHLTNDAIQKQQEDYGRYELGNKISYKEFQRYLDSQTEYKINFMQMIIPQMKSYALDCVRSIFTKIDPNRRQFSFELFGLDFMIDDDLKVWLIEVNANPCLEQSCPLLTKIIPPLIHNTLKIAVDPLSQGLSIDNWNLDKIEHFSKYYQNETDKFECIFDELKDGEEIYKLYEN